MTRQVGPRGIAVLALAAIAGLALAIVGWSQRSTGLVATSVGGLGGHTSTTAAPPAGTGATRSADATPSPSGTQAAPSAQPSATAGIGPLLGSEPYAPFAFLVWPGTVSTAAQQAMSGLTIRVTRQAGGISVVAGVTGQPLPPARFYPLGGKVYVLESNLGDDSADLDYNLGDDGLVVTTAQGHIVS